MPLFDDVKDFFTINVLTKKVVFRNNKAYQEEQVYKILNGFEKLIIDRVI